MDNLDTQFQNNDFKSSLPFSRDVIEDLQEVGGGNVQQTFISSKYGAIHTLPLESILDPDIALISNRWIMKDKPQFLASIQRQAPVTETVYVPKVRALGNFQYNNQTYFFWIEDYISGDTLLERTFTGNLFQNYHDLLIWSAMLHQETQNVQPLRSYYSERIQAFKSIFSEQSSLTNTVGTEFSSIVIRLLDELEHLIPIIVGEEERVSVIHGDLRSKNIIFDNHRMAIIDFEQGVNGGDWFNDLEKLLMLTNIQLPVEEKPFTYRPPLTLEQKRQLINKYIQFRAAQGWFPPKFIQDYEKGEIGEWFISRKRLFDIDNDLSQLVHNYARGWNFFTRQGQFHEQKGVLYLRDKFIRDHLK